MQVSTQDMWKAYRQVPCHESQKAYMVVMVFHPTRKEWLYAEAKGLLFGLTGAVLAFNRIPAFIVAVARRWLAIPVQHYFDDFRIFDILKSKGSCNRFFCHLVQDILGYRVDAAKEQLPNNAAVFLGNVEDYYPSGEPADTIVLKPKDGRAQAIEDEIIAHQKRRRLESGDAKKLRGRVIHLATTCAGKVGKGVLNHINDRAEGKTPPWHEDLDLNLSFLKRITQMVREEKIPRKISLVHRTSSEPRVWTDASFSIDGDGIPDCKLCAIIKPRPPALPKGIVLKVPPAILGLFHERKSQIHMGELLAPICAVLCWPELIRHSSAIFYIDNMGVLCNIVNGAAKHIDAGSLTFALHLRLASLNCTSWWEWVESESNCSDGGSRVGVACPVAEALGIPLVEHEFPQLPENFLRMQPEAWETFWETQHLH